jgi:NADPH:quinone reductase-like Zn-dependent oxidoreductase
MRAVAQDVYGEAEVLSLQEVPVPEPGKRDVLVRVRAAGVDMGVWHLMAGMPLVARLGIGLTKPRLRVRGMDLAGVVDRVGAEVTDLKPGDRVFGVCDTGSFAEYAVAKASRLERMPDNLSFEQAAAAAVSGVTALQAWAAANGVPRNVLIIGASGGVGSFAVQVAKAGGARVTAVCRGSKAEFVTSLGADAVIDYTREPLTGQYDLILDIAGLRRLSTLRALLAPGGTAVVIGGEGGGRWLGGIDRTMRASAGRRTKAVISLVRKPQLVKLRELMESGAVTPAVDRTFALPDAPDAVRYMRNGQVRGKAVVVI